MDCGPGGVGHGPEEAPVSPSVLSSPAEKFLRDIRSRPAQGRSSEDPDTWLAGRS